MTESRDLPSVVDEAQRAAAAGDYVSAEQLLREAAQLQETTLGPLHPDLANTLNNLGVVCEITDSLAEAERCYRRAYAIATTALDPDHPFVATSRKNLTDFCEARGIPVESLPPPPTVPKDADLRMRLDDLPGRSPAPVMAPPVSAGTSSSTGTSSRMLGIAALSGIAVVVLVLIARPLFKANGSNGASSSNPAPIPVAPPVQAPRIESAPDASTRAPGAAPKADARNEGRGDGEVKRQAGAPSSGGTLQVVEAQLCTSLSTGAASSAGKWQCVRPNGPVTSGSLFFYTRLKSPRDATVEHRWYRGNQLRRAFDRAIRANSTEGYRTFSRTTFGKDSAGEWRVELRAKDGTVLREEKFAVR